MKKRSFKPRNPMAKLLISPLFHKRIVEIKKGSGSYNRKKLRKPDKDVEDAH